MFRLSHFRFALVFLLVSGCAAADGESSAPCKKTLCDQHQEDQAHLCNACSQACNEAPFDCSVADACSSSCKAHVCETYETSVCLDAPAKTTTSGSDQPSNAASGVCVPRNEDSFTTTWHPPRHDHACTQEQIDAQVRCLGSDLASPDCKRFTAPDATASDVHCWKCMMTDPGDPYYGPVVLGLGEFSNIAGCIATVDPADINCAKEVQAMDECVFDACHNCTDGRYECEDAAKTGVCAAPAVARCTGSLRTNATTSICFPANSVEAIKSLAPLFCK